MNFTDLIKWSVGVILTWSAVNHVAEIQKQILKAQAYLIYESRTEKWGTPNFLNYRSTQNGTRN